MRISVAASTLTYAGAIPFLAAAILLIAGRPHALQANVELVLRVYSALIISFLAGIHWHIGLSQREAPQYLLWISNAVVLTAWVTVFVEAGTIAWIIFAILFLGLIMLDRLLSQKGLLLPWFYRLRVRITSIVVAALLSTAALAIAGPVIYVE